MTAYSAVLTLNYRGSATLRANIAGATQNCSSSAAARAQAEPKANAVSGDSVAQSQPNSVEAGSRSMPTTRLYQPKAVPDCAEGTRSATSAFSTPSVAARNTPYAPNIGQSSHG